MDEQNVAYPNNRILQNLFLLVVLLLLNFYNNFPLTIKHVLSCEILSSIFVSGYKTFIIIYFFRVSIFSPQLIYQHFRNPVLAR